MPKPSAKINLQKYVQNAQSFGEKTYPDFPFKKKSVGQTPSASDF